MLASVSGLSTTRIFGLNAEVEGREKRSERKRTKKFYKRQVDLILIKKS